VVVVVVGAGVVVVAGVGVAEDAETDGPALRGVAVLVWHAWV
jgi:hypothetical protein